MTVLLVLFFFTTFLLIDHFRSRNAVVVPALQVASAKAAPAPRLTPALVGGFAVPENLRYHPGHTWALSESPTLVREMLLAYLPEKHRQPLNEADEADEAAEAVPA